MTRPSNPANYECTGKMTSNRVYTVHHWQWDHAGIARCLNKGCGIVLSKEDSDDLRHTKRD